MQQVTDTSKLRAIVKTWRKGGQSVAFVPTMGNLHAGHLKLVETARAFGDRVVVSIFVNPLQFSPDEDFEHYPRTLDEDNRRLSQAGVDVVFTPSVDVIYPRGLPNGKSKSRPVTTQVSVPGLNRILCGAFRPGHFDGVTTVVAKLFNLVQPDLAVFGKKDFQQWVLIRRMTEDLNIPVKIVGVDTVREPDGLALSSRNQYLSEAEKKVAPVLYRTLVDVAEAIRQGRRSYALLQSEAMVRLEQAGFQPEYVEIRYADDLSAARGKNRNLVVLAAARLGAARLIDNLEIKF
ncbi:MAG TPA: pantoate--beta-alanine ligase [Gammaproteobacteria bacterium]